MKKDVLNVSIISLSLLVGCTVLPCRGTPPMPLVSTYHAMFSTGFDVKCREAFQG